MANQPTSTITGYTDVTYGNYNTVKLDAALSGPLTDTVDARIAVSTNSHDGYFSDTFRNEPIDDANTRAIRGIVRFHPSSEFTWTLSADLFGEGDHAYGSHYFGQSHPGDVDAGVALGGVLPTNILKINSPIFPEDNRHVCGVTSTIAYEIGDVSLKSITGYRGSDYTTITDLDNTNLSLAGPFPFFEDAHQISQEFPVLGSSGPVKWIGGLYYFDEHVFGGSQIPLNPLLFGGPDFLPNGYQVAGLTHTIAYAGFGQLDFAMTDQLSLILDGRYGYKRVSFDDNSEFDLATPYVEGAPISNLPGFPRAHSTHSDPVTPKATLQYRATASINLYATASKGFKSGGFDLGVLAPPYHPESLWDYEGGIKATTFNGHLRTNLSGFYYKYTNLQESIVSSTSVLTENAVAARLYGTELEFTVVPKAQLQIDGSFTYLNSEYKQFATADPSAPQLGEQNLAGNELAQAPEFAGNLGAQYQFAITAGGLTLRGEAIYSGRVFYTPFDDPAVSTPANVKANAFLTFQSSDQHWTSTAFVRNAFNKVTIANALIASSIVGNPVEGTVSPPRTLGSWLASISDMALFVKRRRKRFSRVTMHSEGEMWRVIPKGERDATRLNLSLLTPRSIIFRAALD